MTTKTALAISGVLACSAAVCLLAATGDLPELPTVAGLSDGQASAAEFLAAAAAIAGVAAVAFRYCTEVGVAGSEWKAAMKRRDLAYKRR